MSGIQGAWPGGPRREAKRTDPGRAWRLESLEDRADRVAAGQRSSRSRKRSRAMFTTLGVAAVFAGVAGFVLGRSSEKTSEEIAAQSEMVPGESGGLEDLIASEGTRVIRNMWLSEIIEKQ